MTIMRYLVVCALVAILVVSGATVIQSKLGGNKPIDAGTSNGAFDAVASAKGEYLNIPPTDPRTMTLNTVAYAENAVKDKVLLPDLTALGSGFRIVGVLINQPPKNVTTNTGITYKHWILDFYISDHPFVNGSTLSTELFAHSILVVEGSNPGLVSSYDIAKEMVAPPGQACAIHVITNSSTTSSSSSCTQGRASNPGQPIKIRNTYVALDPTVPIADFAIDGLNREIVIYPAGPPSPGVPGILSYQQLLGLAWSIITPGSCQTQVPNKGGANLQGANLEYCNLAGYDLSGDNLQNADLQFANLLNANLHGANLKGANLANTFAMGANFQGGTLQNADLTGATLTGLSASQMTNFNGANLQQATLTGATCGSPNYIAASGANTQNAVNVPADCNPPL